MTKECLLKRYQQWARKNMYFASKNDLDDAAQVLSYDVENTAEKHSGISVRVIAVHTNRLHFFAFSIRNTWLQTPEGDDGPEIDTRYKFIFAF